MCFVLRNVIILHSKCCDPQDWKYCIGPGRYPCKQTGRPRNIGVLSAMSVRNTYFGELPDWDLTVELHIYLFMIMLGARFASSYPIYLKNKPWQRPNWRPNGIPCGDIWKNRSGRLTALGLVHSQGRGWPIIVINGGLIRVPLLNHLQHCSFFFFKFYAICSVSADVSVVGGSSIPFIRHYHYLHAGRWECVCVFLCVSGGCLRHAPLIRQQAALLWWLLKLHYYPQVLIDVTQYCVRRQGLLFLYGRHAYYNTFFTAEQGNCPASVMRLSSALMLSTENI